MVRIENRMLKSKGEITVKARRYTTLVHNAGGICGLSEGGRRKLVCRLRNGQLEVVLATYLDHLQRSPLLST